MSCSLGGVAIRDLDLDGTGGGGGTVIASLSDVKTRRSSVHRRAKKGEGKLGYREGGGRLDLRR